MRVHRVPYRALSRFAASLVSQSQRIMALQSLLHLLKPSVVVTEYDRNTFTSCLILSARSLGIPTITMMHGVINSPYGYTPVLADVVLCWGKRHRDQLVSFGVNPNRLMIVGCQRLQRQLTANRIVGSKLGLSADKRVVIYASNPLADEDRRFLARTFCRALTKMEDVQGCVRLHPSERPKEYSAEILSQ